MCRLSIYIRWSFVFGLFLALWTTFGGIIYMIRSISLNLTCGTSGVILIFLFYFIFCVSPATKELDKESYLVVLTVFCIGFSLSISHWFFLFVSWMTKSRRTGEQKRLNQLFEKHLFEKHKLAFRS